ncbi:GNAT family N-acetyltransferase [Natronosalvus halobius]|uniref:GNAT family N-acetyltransferase n=1 Tax=Natronosalvus halobius TaxID=2953746 RepID=UPI0020A0BFBD|nr:GNAT family N-acetyltransferase [Natronosalvus halobius]USZ70254.1 GNAT family N-acetyltransferase [Natronosalvus halobius]
MDIREATSADSERIRSVAQRSLAESYTHFLDDETIDEAAGNWYGDDLQDAVEREHTVYLVAENDGETVGFSQSELVGENHGIGRIEWIHVDPDHRGSGIGPRLLARTRESLLDAGAEQIQGVVLEANEVGNEFYATHGFDRVGSRELDVGDQTHTENVYVESDHDDDAWRALEALEDDGQTRYVSYGEPARGSKAPFYTVYANEAASDRYGWFCGNCDSLDNAMDSMGRIVCNSCDNRRKATRWDASYL